MLKSKLIPTKLRSTKEPKTLEIAPVKAPGRFDVLWLFVTILRFGITQAWMRWVLRRPIAEQAVRVRVFLETMGGLWVKAGQFLSLRTDMLSLAMVQELSALQY